MHCRVEYKNVIGNRVYFTAHKVLRIILKIRQDFVNIWISMPICLKWHTWLTSTQIFQSIKQFLLAQARFFPDSHTQRLSMLDNIGIYVLKYIQFQEALGQKTLYILASTVAKLAFSLARSGSSEFVEWEERGGKIFSRLFI